MEDRTSTNPPYISYSSDDIMPKFWFYDYIYGCICNHMCH
jgi:hypothetical protein